MTKHALRIDCYPSTDLLRCVPVIYYRHMLFFSQGMVVGVLYRIEAPLYRIVAMGMAFLFGAWGGLFLVIDDAFTPP